MAIADTISSMYDNVRDVYDTITNVDVNTGKNLFDKSTITENTYIEENGNIGSSQVTNLSDYIGVKPNTSYTLSYDYSTLLNSNQRNIIYYDENKTYISGLIYLPTNKTNTITTPNNAKYIRFSYDKNCYSIMLNEGNTALPYQPYTDNPTYKNIENIPSTIRKSYLDIMNNGIDKIWNNWEKVTGEGETLTLNSTEEAPMKINLKGNTSQEGTPTPEAPQDIHVVSGDNTIKVEGKNLFDNSVERKNAYPNITFSSIGQPVEYNNSSATYSYVNSAHLKAGQEYTISWAQSTTPVSVNERIGVIVDENNIVLQTQITWINSTDTIKFTSNYNGYLILATDINATNIQIEKGSTATPYEPYQSQTYEVDLGDIELCKIGDYQDNIKKSTGKNLFDKSTITTSAYLKEDGTLQTGTGAEYVTSDFIPVKPNTTYYKTLTLSPRTKFYDANKQVLDNTTYQDVSIGGNAGSFTTPSNAYYFRFTGNVNTSTGININLTMINEGTTALPYEPYGKVWYVNKQIGKVVLNGSGSFTYNSGINSIRYNGIKDNLIDNAIITTISNYFVGCSFSDRGVLTTPRCYFEGNYLQFRGGEWASSDSFKDWLSTHNTTVYYVLATPTDTEITDSTLLSQLEAVKRSYDGQTNITQVNNDLPFILDVTALKQLTQ